MTAQLRMVSVCASAIILSGVFSLTSLNAETQFQNPEFCSTLKSGLLPFCKVEQDPNGTGFVLTYSLVATTSPVQIAGYQVAWTENFGGAYLSPILQLNPGDILKFRFVNALSPGQSVAPPDMPGMTMNGDPTNLHTHGLIVSPNNATDKSKQDGDNIFLTLGRGTTFDYNIKIPTDLPASILDYPSGIIPHPLGLYWYHSHLHGISEAQVAGGMSGLLSIGQDDANLHGKTDQETADLRAKTDVSYLMLRDIQISAATSPVDATGASPANWLSHEDSSLCGTPDVKAIKPVPNERKGYCEGVDKGNFWLFTINGLRFPSLKVAGGRNALLRIGNLSASVSYNLQLIDNASGSIVPFELLNVDGVSPSTIDGTSFVRSPKPLESLLLMPASRAEIYVRNDEGSPTQRIWTVKTIGVNTGGDQQSNRGDHWPEIQLASVILDPAPKGAVAPQAMLLGYEPKPAAPALVERLFGDTIGDRKSCIRDVDRSKLEHRQIIFTEPDEDKQIWGMSSQIVAPRDIKATYAAWDDKNFPPDKATKIPSAPFEHYLKDGKVNWDVRHICVSLSTGHGQLWELYNSTSELHNFHIHQSKFRLATDDDLKKFGIKPPGSTLDGDMMRAVRSEAGNSDAVWHDTIPVEAGRRVFIIINFDAEQQVGKYVIHCHILKHEDRGLMAPIEVLR